MAEQRKYASGDAGERSKRFEICCKANTWDDKAKALKLPPRAAERGGGGGGGGGGGAADTGARR